MKQINTVLPSGEARARAGGGDEADPERLRGDAEGRERAQRQGARPGPDHVDAINQLFAELEFAYHNQFHKAFAREGSLALAKKYWLECLARFAPHTSLVAGRHVVTHQDFLPSVAAVVRACEQAFSLHGLPTPREAYVEACRAPEPKARQAWTHPAVYHAGRATGWFLLANEPEVQAFPVFEYHYTLLCRRVLEGEDLRIDLPPPLPESPGRPLTPEQNRERLRQLREQLKF